MRILQSASLASGSCPQQENLWSDKRNPVRDSFPLQGKAAPTELYWFCAAPAVEKGGEGQQTLDNTAGRRS